MSGSLVGAFFAAPLEASLRGSGFNVSVTRQSYTELAPVLSPGLLLILSAPSGAGKTTLARRLLGEFTDAQLSISYTTRAPRGAEKNGVDYHFIDNGTFHEKVEKGEFLEWAEVHDHFYGSAQQTVDRVMASRGVAVFDIDVQGGRAIKQKYPDALLVFVLPPSMEELERRLRDRKTDSDEEIARRLLRARNEIKQGVGSYDFLVVNDDFERAVGELSSIVIAERCRRGRKEVPFEV